MYNYTIDDISVILDACHACLDSDQDETNYLVYLGDLLDSLV